MDKSTMGRRMLVASWVAAILGISLLILAGCVMQPVQPTADPEAVAQALAKIWATQTAEAQLGKPPSPTAVAATTAPTAAEPPTAVPPTVPPTITSAPPARPTDTPTAFPPPTTTPSPTATAKATPTATVTATPAPVCSLEVASELAPAWEWAKLGCPTAEADVIWAAWQPFQHGAMAWRSDLDWTYVLDWQSGIDPTAGTWVTGGDRWRWDGSFPDGHGLTPPEGMVEPIRGFGFVWWNFLGGSPSQLGWGTGQEKGFCATVQPFERGIIWQSNGQVSACQEGQFNWATDSSFQQVFFALYEDGTWRGY